MDDANQILQPLALGCQDATAKSGQTVVAASRRILLWRRTHAGFLNEFFVNEAFQGAVERRRPQVHFPSCALKDLLHDPVTVLVLAGQRQQNMEPVRLQREETFGSGQLVRNHIYMNSYIYPVRREIKNQNGQ